MIAHDQAELARVLFEEIGDALFLLDPATDQLLDVNPVALSLTGFTRDELMASPASHLFRFEDGGAGNRLGGAFNKTVVFHGQDGFLLRTKDDAAWVPVNLTVSRLHVAPKPLGLILARDDRDRRAAFTQTRRVEAELRKVLAGSPAALWSAERPPGPDVAAGWQFRYVSPLLARIAGRSPDFLTHPLRWVEVIHPADREAYQTGLHRLLADQQAAAESTYRIVTGDGAVRWVRDRLQVIRDLSGRPTRLDGCLTDVTDQRQTEDALRQSEQRFRAVVEKSREGILLLDEAAVIRYASPAVRSILGFDPPEVIGQGLFSLIDADDHAATRERLARILARPGEGVGHTFRGLAAQGSIRVVEMTGVNRLADPSVRAVVVNYRDVTERDRAARELARQHSILEGLFASVPDLLCYKDRNLRFLGGNPAFEALAGLPVADLIGRTCDEVFHEDWAARLRAVEPAVLATGQPVRAQEWVTYPDGRQALLDFVVTRLVGDDDTLGLIIAGRDVTERARLEEQLRQSQKMEAVGRLAGGIAHDFNNLLTVILGNLELVRSVPPADGAELITACERAARQAAELTRQMLGFARRQPIRTATLDFVALVRDALALIRRSIDPRITFTFTPPADLRPVAADPVQVQQVLMNLCLNARDAMPGGGTLTVEVENVAALPPDAEVTADHPHGYVRLSVTDTGTGMTPEVRARIFEPFFTTKGVGQGTGLGLAVVYGAARAHGGWVACASEPGRGSRFDVYWPCAVAPEETAPCLPDQTPPPRGHGETVLVADDEPGVRSLAAAILDRHGYKLVLATDGAEAVAAFQAGRVDLVVLDATMPTMNGRQAFDAIRRLDPTARVLFASGYPASQSLPEEPDPHVGFLNKPYTPNQLALAIRQMLDGGLVMLTNGTSR